MRVVNRLIDFLRRLFGSAEFAQIDTVEIWEEYPDHWKFRAGNVTWGDFPSYADAERVATNYNGLKVKEGR